MKAMMMSFLEASNNPVDLLQRLFGSGGTNVKTGVLLRAEFLQDSPLKPQWEQLIPGASLNGTPLYRRRTSLKDHTA